MTGHENLPVFDLASALAGMGDDVDIFREVAATFSADAPNQIVALRSALESRDLKTALRIVHTLKSSSRIIGGARLSALAALHEDTMRAGTFIESSDFVNLQATFLTLQEALKGMLG